MRTNKRTFPPAQVVPESYLEPIEWGNIFGRIAPLEVDLGCGDGTFLVALAEQNAGRNFLGVDLLAGRIRAACRKIGDQQIENARVLRLDILHAVQQLFARGSVDVFHLMFPDPWPKRRHHDRRVVTEEFLRAISRALKPDGAMQIATDHADYFAHIQRVVLCVPALFQELDESLPLPASTFEQRFHERGLEIHRLVLRKVSAPR